MNICIISCDTIFSRMLELELSGCSAKVRIISEKLNPPALKLAIQNFGLIIFDASYYSNNISFVGQIKNPCIVITKDTSNVDVSLYDNVTAVFERPFLIDSFLEHISDQGVCNKFSSPRSKDNTDCDIELDQFSKRATVNGKIIKFSPKEFSLLTLLYKNRGRTVSRRIVLDTVWGNDNTENKNIDNVYINYLRKKLDYEIGIKLIYTVRGKGYMLK